MERRRAYELKLFISMCEIQEVSTGVNGDIPLSVDTILGNLVSKEEMYLLRRIVLEKATYLELSKELGITVWTCQKRMQRLLKKLKEKLENE